MSVRVEIDRKDRVLRVTPYKVVQGHRAGRAPATSYQWSTITNGLSSTVSEINGDSGGKRIFLIPVYLMPTLGIL